MFCDGCGASLAAGAGFCPACGKQIGAAPSMPAHSRLAGHVRLLGIFWIALSAFRFIPGVILWTLFRPGAGLLPLGIPLFVHGLARAAGGIFMVCGVIGIAAGWGLLERQPWARILAIALGFVNLVDMPFGTALGIYTLWVLLPARNGQEYEDLEGP
jgi:hypothetical protein